MRSYYKEYRKPEKFRAKPENFCPGKFSPHLLQSSIVKRKNQFLTVSNTRPLKITTTKLDLTKKFARPVIILL